MPGRWSRSVLDAEDPIQNGDRSTTAVSPRVGAAGARRGGAGIELKMLQALGRGQTLASLTCGRRFGLGPSLFYMIGYLRNLAELSGATR